ncbi:hypothetical protein KEM55_000281 [Ascosphaera atra]|nr:hypothetical protein KEM55_000281 [Ascosphaera atra]
MFRISCFRALGLNASKGISPLFNASTPLLRKSIAPESSQLTKFFASSSPFRCYASSTSKPSPPKATPPPPRPTPIRTQPPKPAQVYSPLPAFNKAIVDAGGSAVLYVAPATPCTASPPT